MDPERFLEIRYEALTERPRQVMEQVVDFLALPQATQLVDQVVAEADPARQAKWRSELTPEVQEAVRPHLEPTLRWLGYQW